MENGQIQFDKVEEYIRSFPDLNTQKRLLDRVEDFQILQDIPERAWWLNKASIQNPEERARNMWNEYRNENAENQERMLRIMATLPGFASKRFIAEFNRIRQEERR